MDIQTDVNSDKFKEMDPNAGYFVEVGFVYHEYHDGEDKPAADDYLKYNEKSERLGHIPFTSIIAAREAINMIDFNQLVRYNLNYGFRNYVNVTAVYKITTTRNDTWFSHYVDRSAILDKIDVAKNEAKKHQVKQDKLRKIANERRVGRVNVLLEDLVNDKMLVARTELRHHGRYGNNTTLTNSIRFMDRDQYARAIQADNDGIDKYDRDYDSRWDGYWFQPADYKRGHDSYNYKKFWNSTEGEWFKTALANAGIDLLTKKEKTRAPSFVEGMSQRRLMEKAVQLVKDAQTWKANL